MSLTYHSRVKFIHNIIFIDILDNAKQPSFLEWVSMIDGLLGKVQPVWIIKDNIIN